MIEVKKDEAIDVSEEAVEDVNAGIHKEYNLLVYRYANLLKQYLDLQKEHMELLKRDSDTLRELIELKEMHKKRTVRFGASYDREDDLK